MNTPTPLQSLPSKSWDTYYRAGVPRWQSTGLSSITAEFLRKYSQGNQFFEVGCGNGADAVRVTNLDYAYTGIDISKEAIRQAQSKNIPGALFQTGALQSHSTIKRYNVLYDKGVFHNQPGPDARVQFAQYVAGLLATNGIWISICGSADHYNQSNPHGAVFLQHIITPIEELFEILEIQKAPYGIQKPHQDFLAWYCIFRKREAES